jgi:hypothetical protein
MVFQLGQIAVSPKAGKALADAGQTADYFVQKHLHNEHGDAPGIILSGYLTSQQMKIWVLTTEDRSSTTVLLPEEHPEKFTGRPPVYFSIEGVTEASQPRRRREGRKRRDTPPANSPLTT